MSNSDSQPQVDEVLVELPPEGLGKGTSEVSSVHSQESFSLIDQSQAGESSTMSSYVQVPSPRKTKSKRRSSHKQLVDILQQLDEVEHRLQDMEERVSPRKDKKKISSHCLHYIQERAEPNYHHNNIAQHTADIDHQLPNCPKSMHELDHEKVLQVEPNKFANRALMKVVCHALGKRSPTLTEDLKIVPPVNLEELADGFLERARSSKKPLEVAIGYKIAFQSSWHKIRQEGFGRYGDEKFDLWKSVPSCMSNEAPPTMTVERLQEMHVVLNNLALTGDNSVQDHLSALGERYQKTHDGIAHLLPPMTTQQFRNLIGPSGEVPLTKIPPLHLWMVATLLNENHPEEENDERLTTKQCGWHFETLPVACVDTKSIHKDELLNLAALLQKAIHKFLRDKLQVNVISEELRKLRAKANLRSAGEQHRMTRVLDGLKSIVKDSPLNATLTEDNQDGMKGFVLEDCIARAQMRPNYRRNPLFLGFQIHLRSEFQNIQSGGLEVGPGFHLAKTIGNARSFWHFHNKSDEKEEHLWMVLGLRNACDEVTVALPLVCIEAESINKDAASVEKLVGDLQRWTNSLLES